MADKKRNGNNNKQEFNTFIDKVRMKRGNNKIKGKTEKSSDLDYLTVQRLSKSVEGKVQKYCRIGPLTMVKLGKELTLQNIKLACEEHFDIKEDEECDILAGERGPSFTEISQIKKFDPLHIRFVDKKIIRKQEEESSNVNSCNSSFPKSVHSRFLVNYSRKHATVTESSLPSVPNNISSGYVASVPASKFLKLGKLIAPTKSSPITFTLEEFNISTQKWLEPFDAKFSLDPEPLLMEAFVKFFEHLVYTSCMVILL